MKEKMHLLMLYIIVSGCMYAQQINEEELVKLTVTQTGTEKLVTLYDLQQAFLYEPKDWYYNEQLLKEAEKQNNSSYVSIALRNRVAYYYRIFDSDSIFYYANIAESYAEKHNQKRDWFLVKQLIIQRYLDQGHYSLGLREAMNMSKAAQKSNDVQMEASALEFLAKAYQALGKPKEAICYLKRARKELLNRRDTPYKKLGYYLLMSYLYEDDNQADSVYIYSDSLQTTIREFKEKNHTYNLKDYEIGNNLSRVYYYIKNNQLDKAWKQIEKTEKLVEESNSQYFVFLLDLKKIKYYQVKKEYEKMNICYDLAYNYCVKNSLERGIRYLLRLKAMTLGEQGLHTQAVEGYKKLENHVDSVNHERFLYEINQLGMEFELDKKEDRIKQQTKELKLKNQLTIVLTILFILSFFAIVIIFRYLKIIKNKNKYLFQQMRDLTETKSELMQFKECIRERVGVGIVTDCSDKDKLLFEKVEEFMNKEKPYINSEYGRKNLISDMNTNEVYLSRSIRKGINMTIQEYINAWRMEYAKYILLKDMNMTIETVSMDAGFSSIRNFYRLFKETYGMSPSEFRNYVKKNYKT